MDTLIVYATKYGSTEKCVAILSEKLTGKAEQFNLKSAKVIDLAPYDRIIIGGSIYMGKIQKEVTDFCAKNLNELTKKKTGLFICGMLDEEAETELNRSFPQELLTSAVVKDYFGGEYALQNMKSWDRYIVKKVAKVEKDLSKIREENIERFAQAMNNV